MCQVNVNGLDAQCVLDAGSGISLASRPFTLKHRIPTIERKGSLAAVANRGLLNISEACV